VDGKRVGSAAVTPDRRYSQTRQYFPDDGAGEALARADRYRSRMQERSINADRSPLTSSSQAPGEAQQRRAAALQDAAAVFDEYGSGEWGSGDDSIRQLRREAYFRPDLREG
jgi:hypothetical protein